MSMGTYQRIAEILTDFNAAKTYTSIVFWHFEKHSIKNNCIIIMSSIYLSRFSPPTETLELCGFMQHKQPTHFVLLTTFGNSVHRGEKIS